MAKRTYDELLKEYGLERKETDFERDMKTYGSKIQTGIEASKKRNAELAAENAKRRKNEESGYTKPEKPSPSAPKSTPKKSPIASATTVRQHKGGGATAEVDTERVARQTRAEKATRQEAAKKSSKTASQKPQTKLTSSDEGTITPAKTSTRASTEKRTEEPAKKRIDYYNGGPEWRQAIKRTLTAPLRLVARAAEKQEKKKKGSRYGSPYQLRVR